MVNSHKSTSLVENIVVISVDFSSLATEKKEKWKIFYEEINEKSFKINLSSVICWIMKYVFMWSQLMCMDLPAEMR